MTPRRQDSPSDSLVKLPIERIGGRGDGIGWHRGEPVFLPFTAPGDRVCARLGARRGDGREGWVVDRLISGPGRADPPCPHLGTCGGCAVQHLDPASYRAVKLGMLHASLKRAGIDHAAITPLRVVPPARRRAGLGLVRPRDPRLSVLIGYRERFLHTLVDLRECPVLEPSLFALAGNLRLVARDLLPPGAAAEATITRIDSGIDLLIEAAEQPGLSVLEALAGFAEEWDLARIVWLSPP